MKITLLAFILLILNSTFSFADENKRCVNLPWQISDYINKHAYKEWGYESCNTRDILKGNISENSQKNIAVKYTIVGACGSFRKFSAGSCGNHFETYLAVFEKKNNSWYIIDRIMVGYCKRSVSLRRIDNKIIYADTFVNQKNDGDCCPSKKGEITFVLKDKKIIEIPTEGL